MIMITHCKLSFFNLSVVNGFFIHFSLITDCACLTGSA